MKGSEKSTLRLLTLTLLQRFVHPVSLESRRVAQANSNFSLGAYEILKDENDFTVFSPLALTNALLALATGARGHTQNVLISGLRLKDLENFVLNTGFADILFSVKEQTHRAARFRSKLEIFIPTEISYSSDYADVLQTKFNGTITGISAEEAKEMVEFETNPAYSSGPVGILVSASSFLGPWKKKFGVASTRPGHFFLNNNDRVSVSMMNHDDYFYHADLPEVDAAALMLPLEGNQFGFIILLPNERTGLPALESTLKSHPVSQIPGKLKRKWVELWLPKFELNSTLPLVQNGFLSKLGMGGISHSSADFGTISCGGDLFFTDVTQRTSIQVNEEGIGGLNPSVPRVDKLTGKRDRVTFNVDHPFLFFIYDYPTKSILILGRKIS